jgi:hypothetical protein
MHVTRPQFQMPQARHDVPTAAAGQQQPWQANIAQLIEQYGAKNITPSIVQQAGGSGDFNSQEMMTARANSVPPTDPGVVNKLSQMQQQYPLPKPAPAPVVAPPVAQPGVVNKLTQRQGMASGGEVFHMQTGGHVFPAFDVATFGNGSTKAGQAKLAKMGGIPINGGGDGVSDSIKAMIDGKQKARVADGEVYFPPEAVERQGGTKKLYALMHAAEKARKRTNSGNKVKGLA